METQTGSVILGAGDPAELEYHKYIMVPGWAAWAQERRNKQGWDGQLGVSRLDVLLYLSKERAVG